MVGGLCDGFSQQQTNGVNYQLGPMPSVHKPLAENLVPMGSIRTFEEVKLDLPITSGPYAPTWKSIETNYPGCTGMVAGFQIRNLDTFWTAVGGESGDWYVRKMYVEGTQTYENHLKNYGHPSEVGYKEVLRDWNPKKFNPQCAS